MADKIYKQKISDITKNLLICDVLDHVKYCIKEGYSLKDIVNMYLPNQQPNLTWGNVINALIVDHKRSYIKAMHKNVKA